MSVGEIDFFEWSKKDGLKRTGEIRDYPIATQERSVLGIQVEAMVTNPIEALGCHASCMADNTVPGALAAGAIVMGQNTIPTGPKTKGTTPKTSIASKLSRKALGRRKAPIKMWSPTLKNKKNFSKNYGTVIGRLTPVGGYVGAYYTGWSVDQCSASCSKDIIND